METNNLGQSYEEFVTFASINVYYKMLTPITEVFPDLQKLERKKTSEEIVKILLSTHDKSSKSLD